MNTIAAKFNTDEYHGKNNQRKMRYFTYAKCFLMACNLPAQTFTVYLLLGFAFQGLSSAWQS